jgi:PPOX class probable F420-dependent enzyme
MDSYLAPVTGAKTILLTTYKRDGTPVATAVSIAFDGGRAVFRTYDRAWKARRLRRDDRVLIAPATLLGKATGPSAGARAALLEGEQARAAARALARQHLLLQGLLVPLAHRLRGYRTLHYELRPEVSRVGEARPGR